MSLFSPVVEVAFSDLVDLDETENKISPNDDIDKPLLSPLFSDLDAEDDDPNFQMLLTDRERLGRRVDGLEGLGRRSREARSTVSRVDGCYLRDAKEIV